jgi:hypothetical protein
MAERILTGLGEIAKELYRSRGAKLFKQSPKHTGPVLPTEDVEALYPELQFRWIRPRHEPDYSKAEPGPPELFLHKKPVGFLTPELRTDGLYERIFPQSYQANAMGAKGMTDAGYNAMWDAMGQRGWTYHTTGLSEANRNVVPAILHSALLRGRDPKYVVHPDFLRGLTELDQMKGPYTAYYDRYFNPPGGIEDYRRVWREADNMWEWRPQEEKLGALQVNLLGRIPQFMRDREHVFPRNLLEEAKWSLDKPAWSDTLTPIARKFETKDTDPVAMLKQQALGSDALTRALATDLWMRQLEKGLSAQEIARQVPESFQFRKRGGLAHLRGRKQ